ncbi:hypothetical protein ABIE93_005948 [Bradyrhizobium elkanii]
MSKDMTVGSIVFGPRPTAPVPRQHSSSLQGAINATPFAHACNCIGPQPGQTKCPCILRGEAAMGQRMIEEGVTVNGQRYRLVPDPQ